VIYGENPYHRAGRCASICRGGSCSRQFGHDADMAKPPESTKTSLRQRLTARARWPELAGITVRWHGAFADVDGQLPGGTAQPLCRLRSAGSASTWGFAIHRASHNDFRAR
jgi:hypothetical protein